MLYIKKKKGGKGADRGTGGTGGSFRERSIRSSPGHGEQSLKYESRRGYQGKRKDLYKDDVSQKTGTVGENLGTKHSVSPGVKVKKKS